MRTKRKLNHEKRVLLIALAAGAPGVVVALALLWAGGYTAKVCWTLAALVVGCWLGFAFALRARVRTPLQTASNLLAALREGDYSIRARGGRSSDDALDELLREVNLLSEVLREQRIGAIEATTLLRTVMRKIDVAVFAFDGEERLCLVNRAGERLLARPVEQLLGRTAAQAGLAECMKQVNGETTHTLHKTFLGTANRVWGVRHSTFRRHGRPARLLVLTDISRPLREEERTAYKRLVRVLGHELNNSLAPIKSIAGSLSTLTRRDPRPTDWQDDMERGLRVIQSRAESLARFVEAYSQLARLPPPRLQQIEIGALVRRAANLETSLRVCVAAAPEVTVEADADQLEQLLINVLRNAAEAAAETGGGVCVGWKKGDGYVDVCVRDEGLGLADTANLFVPFFTTKPGGSGIGLVLARQIAEAHGGTLTLENQVDRRGCEARLRLPC